MKTMRKILSLALAMLLVLALSVTAFAAEEKGTITVTGDGGTVYTLYKIFNTTVVDNGGEDGFIYQLTDDFADFTAEGYFTVEAGKYIIWKKNPTSVADAAAIAQLAKQYIAGKTLTSAGTVTAGGASVEVAPGYYLLVPTEGPCGVKMIKANTETVVQEKTTAAGHPVVEKLVFEDSTNRYQSFNTVDYGQTIQYQTTITAGVAAENYILHDKMDEHIKYTNAFTLLRDGNVLPAENNYEIIENPGCESGCTFHVKFSESLCSSLHEGAKIIVQYTGALKPVADTQTAHENTTWLTYKNGVPSNESTVNTATFSVTVEKEDQNGLPLAGATFILKDNVGNYYSKDVNGNIVWTTKENALPLTTTVENGATIVFDGVDAENFTLEEIVVPNGYTGSTTDAEASTKDGLNGNGKNVTVQVTNTLGQTLPETGGIGTTVFYIAGAVLVLCALAAVVVIKRKEA